MRLTRPFGSMREGGLKMAVLDAPWIRDAERNGFGDADPAKCPVCGKSCWTYFISSSVVCGCEQCFDESEELLEPAEETDANDWNEMWEG